MAYLGNSPQFATQIPYRYTIAGSAKTTITGLDDLGKALTYSPGYIAVYVNGVKLIDTQDYTATSGSSVVFVNAVQIGDTVEIIAYGTYSINYAYRTAAVAPINPSLGDLWYDTTTGILAIYVSDGTTSTWMQIAPTGILDPTLSQFVRTDGVQTLTAAQQTQVRQNIAAAPFDALAYNGLQVNGSMEVSQENGTNAVAMTAGGNYSVDGWRGGLASSGAGTFQQVADAPPGYSNSLKLAITTAVPSLTTDICNTLLVIEGYRTSRLQWGTLNAQPISIGFWTKINRVGLYAGSVRNSASTRTYLFGFTQNVSNAWEYKTVTVPGDTTGTWIGNTNGIGIKIAFMMAAGTSITAANTWTVGDFYGIPGMVNGIAATSDTFQITGVVVVPGIELPSASRAPFIMRPFDQELETCRRYLQTQQGHVYGGYVMPDAANVRVAVALSPLMRVAPTTLVKNASGIAINGQIGTLALSVSGAGLDTGGCALIIQLASGVWTPGQGVVAFFAPGSFLFDARL